MLSPPFQPRPTSALTVSLVAVGSVGLGIGLTALAYRYRTVPKPSVPDVLPVEPTRPKVPLPTMPPRSIGVPFAELEGTSKTVLLRPSVDEVQVAAPPDGGPVHWSVEPPDSEVLVQAYQGGVRVRLAPGVPPGPRSRILLTETLSGRTGQLDIVSGIG